MPTLRACKEPGCAFTTTSKNGIWKHARIHSDERPYVCGAGCGAAFKQSFAMYRHEKQHSSLPPQASAALRCATGGCDYVASSHDALRRHRNGMHHPESGALWCKACGFIAATRSAMVGHKKQHNAQLSRVSQRGAVEVETAEGSLLARASDESTLSQDL